MADFFEFFNQLRTPGLVDPFSSVDAIESLRRQAAVQEPIFKAMTEQITPSPTVPPAVTTPIPTRTASSSVTIPPASASSGAQQTYQGIINVIKEAMRTGKAVQIGNIVYDPTKDVERWWHGSSANRLSRGESSGQRLIKWLSESAKGQAHSGVRNLQDVLQTFGDLTNLMLGAAGQRKWKVRKDGGFQRETEGARTAALRDLSKYGFWITNPDTPASALPQRRYFI